MSDNRILFSDKNYRLLMTGQTVSTLGNSVSSFAFFAYTLALTQSPFYAALVSGCVTLAIVVMGIPAGIWADKHRPLPLMLSSTILGGAGICVVVANHFGSMGQYQHHIGLGYPGDLPGLPLRQHPDPLVGLAEPFRQHIPRRFVLARRLSLMTPAGRGSF